MIRSKDPEWAAMAYSARRARRPYRLPAARPHDCVVPHPDPTDVPAGWTCPTCGTRWLLAGRARARHWLRARPGPGPARPLGWGHVDRHPNRYAPALTSFDLDRQERVADLLDLLDLPAANLEAARFSNPSAHGPYHGYHHLLCVALNAYEGARASGLDHRDELVSMLLAGLWHDFGHTLDASVDDSVNVACSVSAWLDLGRVVNARESTRLIDEVARLIGATRFPHADSERLDELLIGDADLLQWCEPDRGRFLEGLEAESGVHVNAESGRDFARTHGGRTPWARERLDAAGA